MVHQGAITISDACELYSLDNKSRGLAASTTSSYDKKLSIFVAWLAGEGVSILQEITPIHLRKFLVAMQERDLSIAIRSIWPRQ